MADNIETPPIAVNASPVNDQVAALIRTLLLLIGAVTALAGFIAKRDLAGFITYVQSREFLQVAGVLLTAGTFAWASGRRAIAPSSSPPWPPIRPSRIPSRTSSDPRKEPLMFRSLVAGFLALALTACTGMMPGLPIAAAPAPLAQTTIEDKGLETA